MLFCCRRVTSSDTPDTPIYPAPDAARLAAKGPKSAITVGQTAVGGSLSQGQCASSFDVPLTSKPAAPGPKQLGQRLLRAAREGSANDIQALLPMIKQVGGSLDERNFHGMTALMLAAESGHVEALRVLVDAHVASGKSLNAVDAQGATALALAAECGHLSVVRLLVDSLILRGEVINARDCYGLGPLAQAALSDRSDTLIILLEGLSRAGESPFPDGTNAHLELSLAASRGSLNSLQILIEAVLKMGGSLDFPDSSGQTPLMTAIENGQTDAADLLRQNGACLEAVAERSKSASLHLSNVQQGYVQMVAHRGVQAKQSVISPATWKTEVLPDSHSSFSLQADGSTYMASAPQVVRL